MTTTLLLAHPNLTWTSRPISGSCPLPSQPVYTHVRVVVAFQSFVLAGLELCLHPSLLNQVTPRALKVEGTWVLESDLGSSPNLVT